jgi:hypothetical protein
LSGLLHLDMQADAIIANPISYGHISLADHLGLPLHWLWTQPETATRVRPLPLQVSRIATTSTTHLLCVPSTLLLEQLRLLTLINTRLRTCYLFRCQF